MTTKNLLPPDILYKMLEENNLPPDPNKHYKFSVLLRNYSDLDNFYNEMESKGIGSEGLIPDRKVSCINRKPISRSTIYALTHDEAGKLLDDSRVEAIELTMDERNLKYVPSSTTETANWDKSANISNSMRNWALLRCTNGSQISNWGSDGITAQGNMITLTNTGKNVDVVIIDGIIDQSHPEFAVNADGTGGSRVNLFNWFSLSPQVTGQSAGTYSYVDTVGGNAVHGHHVGGIAAGNTCGWARNANIYNINPYGLNGISADDAINYVRAWHKQKPINPLTGQKNPTVVNMSFGGVAWMWLSPGSGSIFPCIFANNIGSITHRGVTTTQPTSPPSPNPDTTGLSGNWSPQQLVSLGCRLIDEYLVQYGAAAVLCGSRDSSLDADVLDGVSEGIIFVAAAGNNWQENNDVIGSPDYNNSLSVCDRIWTYGFGLPYGYKFYDNYYHMKGISPASAQSGSAWGASDYQEILCVGNIDTLKSEQIAYTSNVGKKLNILAPGSEIMSAWQNYTSAGVPDPRNSYYYLNKDGGTSMASPQIAGIVACLAEQYPNLTQKQAIQFLQNYANKNVIPNTCTTSPSGYQCNYLLGGAFNGMATYIGSSTQQATTGSTVGATTYPPQTYAPRQKVGVAYPRTKVATVANTGTTKASTPPVWIPPPNTNAVVLNPFTLTISLSTPASTPITAVTAQVGTVPSWAALTWSGTTVYINGTPNTLSMIGQTSHVILNATNAGGTTPFTTTITVINGPQPSFGYPGTAPATISMGTIIFGTTLAASTQYPVNHVLSTGLSYTGTLPTGVTFSKNNGYFSLVGTPPYGTPSSYNITVKATNPWNTTGVTQLYNVATDVDPTLTPQWVISQNTSYPDPNTNGYTVLNACTIHYMLATPSDGPLTSVSIASGTLPTGLTFSSYSNTSPTVATIVVTGTPTVAIPSTAQPGDIIQDPSFKFLATNKYGPDSVGNNPGPVMDITIIDGIQPTWIDDSTDGDGTYSGPHATKYPLNPYDSGNHGFTVLSSCTINYRIAAPSDGPVTSVSIQSGAGILPVGLTLKSTITTLSPTTYLTTIVGTPNHAISATASSGDQIEDPGFTLVAKNKYGTVLSNAMDINIINGQLPTWTDQSTPYPDPTTNGYTVQNACTIHYTLNVPADGPITSVTIKTGTTLPGGLSIGTTVSSNPTTFLATISGTPNHAIPTGSGTNDQLVDQGFTLKATNKYGTTTQDLDISIINGIEPVWVTTATTYPDPVTGGYTVQNACTIHYTIITPADGPITAISVLTGTTLPGGLSVSTVSSNPTTFLATISGTPNHSIPTGSGTNDQLVDQGFTLKATNKYGITTQDLDINIINGALPVWSTNGDINLPDTTVFSTFSQSLTFNATTDGPVTAVTLAPGSGNVLPALTTLSFTGGIAYLKSSSIGSLAQTYDATSSTFSFILRATNKYGYTEKNVNIKLNNGPAPTFQFGQTDASLYLRVAYSKIFSATGATSVFFDTSADRIVDTVSVLPTGLTCTTNTTYCTLAGKLASGAGSLSVTGTTSITIRATNKYYPGNGASSNLFNGPTQQLDINYNWCDNGNASYDANSSGGTGSHVFTVPQNVGELRVLLIGGGGGGASCGTYVGVGGHYTGGSGGQSGRLTGGVVETTPGANLNLSNGAGGAGGTNGAAGGGGTQSTFSGVTAAAGGGGGYQGGGGGGGVRDNSGSCGSGGAGGKGGKTGISGSCSCQPCNGYTPGNHTVPRLNLKGNYSTDINWDNTYTPCMTQLTRTGGDMGWNDGGSAGGMGGGGDGGISIFDWGCGQGAGGGGNGGNGGDGYGGGGGGGSPTGYGDTSQSGGNGANGCVYIEWGDPNLN